jgi:putative MATE family efflux protein
MNNELMNDKLTIDLNAKALLSKTIFSIGLLIFTSLYTIVDSIFVSNYINTTALAAINISLPITSVLGAFYFMISSGGNAWVSIRLGMGDKDRANRDFSLIIYFGVLVAVLLELIILPNIDFIVKSLGAQSGDLYTYTKDYLFILTLFTPLFLLQIIFQGFLFVEGNGKLALILTVICGLANVLFDYLFIAILDLGIVGAAYGTSIGFLIGAIGGLYFFLKNKKGLHLGKFSRNMRVIVGTLTNGSSEMVTNVSTAITTFMFNALTLKYAGADGVAAITIILYCQFLFCSIFFGFSMGASPLIGYAWGAKKYKYTRDLLRLCYKLVIIFQLIMFAISITQASLIASMFTSSDNPVFELSTHGLRIFSFSFLFCGISIFSSSVFTALGDGKRSAFLSFVRVFVFTIFFLYTLPLIWGLDGIWLAIPIAEALMVIIDIIFLVKLSHRLTDFSHEKKLRAI